MLTFVFVILMFVVFGKMIGLAFKATWGITKILFRIVFLPIVLILMVVNGLIHIAVPTLVVVGITSMLDS